MATLLTTDRPQVFFHIKEMTSERSADVVVGALKKLDDGAAVRVDLPMRRVEIEPKTADPAAIRDAITNAGYSTVRQWPSNSAFVSS
jgi:copper chaperone CopZ